MVSNCVVIAIVIPFAALYAKFGHVEDVEVFTEQAVSGCGLPRSVSRYALSRYIPNFRLSGVPSMDKMDDVIPYIAGEEDKLENAAQKILGSVNSDANAIKEQQGLTAGATYTRVGVSDGHMAIVSLRFRSRNSVPTAEQAKAAIMRENVAEAHKLGCISAPEQAIVVFYEPGGLNRDLIETSLADSLSVSDAVESLPKDPILTLGLLASAITRSSVLQAPQY